MAVRGLLHAKFIIGMVTNQNRKSGISCRISSRIRKVLVNKEKHMVMARMGRTAKVIGDSRGDEGDAEDMEIYNKSFSST
jgi:hypothetical protein